MSFRLFSRSAVFFDNAGGVLAGGVAKFYDTGTTTARSVYADSALSTNLGNEVTLDAAGRFAEGIWGSGTYRVRLYTSAGVEVSEDDPVADPAGSGLSIPALAGNSGELLTNNGSVLQWVEYLSKVLPDMEGNDGRILSTDGVLALWKTETDLGLPEFTNTGGTRNFTIGPFLVQFGSDSFPVPTVSPPHGATKAITFPVAFAAAPVCYGAFANKITIASSGFRPVVATEATATTITADYNVNENTTDPGADVSVGVPFSWFAIGTPA
jgi:hypothetical protein